MADAEVKLNFTAQVEQARAAIAEVAAAMEKLQASGGVMRPEDAALLNEMQGRLVAYKARLDELSAAYRQLQAGGGEANGKALEQIGELEERVAALTKAQDALLKKVVDLQAANNELRGGVKDVAAETERAGSGGVRVTRSMRGIIANFIRDLMRGRLAVRELGIALKGLAYSTVVLGAIQLAMEGIGLVWEKIRGVFSEGEGEMEAAREAAEKARERLEEAKREAERAADEVQKLKDRLAEREAAETLRETLAGITAEYAAQRDAVNDMLAAVKEQAQVKARERAAEAAAKTGEMDMELLELEERFATGGMGKRDYIVQKAEIEKRKREEGRNAEVDSAEIARNAAEAERDRIRGELDASNGEVERLRRELAKKATPEEAELARKNLEATRKERAAKAEELARKRAGFNERYSGFGRLEGTEFVNDGTGLRWMLPGARAQFAQGLAEIRMLDRQRLALKEREGVQKDAADAAARSSGQYLETARRLEEERKAAAGLEGRARAAEDGARRANAALAETLARTAREGGLDDRMTDKRVGIELAKVANDERGKAGKAAAGAEKGRLRGRVSELLQDARAAAGTKGDKDDDAAALKAISDFIRDQGDEIERYGVNVRSLIDVCRKLSNGNDRVKARVDSLASEIRQLQRTVDKRTAGP